MELISTADRELGAGSGVTCGKQVRIVEEIAMS